MREKGEEWLIGKEDVAVRPREPYNDLAIQFLEDFSARIRLGTEKNTYPDLMSLAFFCRKGNLLKLKENAGDLKRRLGRGLIFHITPANVPINFAFSYFFGLLAGNANIVRVPSKDFPQIRIICGALLELFREERYREIKEGTAFVRYGHEKEVTDRLLSKADGRVIWGGDRTIREIRTSPIKPKCVEIVFADRYSIGLLDSGAVIDASEEECGRLAKGFYNDTYLMDQNACSTPHLLLWTGEGQERAKEKFWNAVSKEAERYPMQPIQAMDKYTDLCKIGMEGKLSVKQVSRWGNRLYVVDLKGLPEDLCGLRGRYGMFFQYALSELPELAPYITERVQTLLYYGKDRQELSDFVTGFHLLGIDRIVPFGNALSMNPYWDGYDIIGQLSRRIIFD